MSNDSPAFTIEMNDTALAALDDALYEGLELRRQYYRENPLPLFEDVRADNLAPLNAIAEIWRREASRIIIIGMGGASLGGQVLAQLYGHLSPVLQPTPHLIFTETLSPDDIASLFSTPEDCRFLIISKSGATIETLTKTKMLLAALEKAKLKAADVACVITDNIDSPLRVLATNHNIKTLAHSADIGGRYSVLSNVGLLPCLLMGGNASALKQGADKTLTAFLTTPNSSIIEGAAYHLSQIKAGRPIAVLMPYIAQLERFTFWYRQLWAESLGKQGQAILPVNALGPADQHSQLQLYSAGADDKSYTLITQNADNAYGRLLTASAQAMAETLASAGRPVRVLHLSTLDEKTIGSLFMHFMLETILVGDMLGINPFDQPAVDDVKKRITKIMETL